MRNILLALFVLSLVPSCIPLRIAPQIEDYKIIRGKKFKRNLSERQMFVFEDPKQAEQLYSFINKKFNLKNENVYDDVPFVVDGKQYFFAFYEIEIPDKALNLGPLLVDLVLNMALENEAPEFYLADESRDIIRTENWYVAIEVYSDLEKDCLAKGSLSREAVLKYLRDLKNEYLATNNYNETVFKN